MVREEGGRWGGRERSEEEGSRRKKSARMMHGGKVVKEKSEGVRYLLGCLSCNKRKALKELVHFLCFSHF